MCVCVGGMHVGMYVRVQAHVSAHTHAPVGASRRQHRVSYTSCLEFTIASDKAQVRHRDKCTPLVRLFRDTPANFRALCAAGLVTTVAIVLAGD